MIFLVFAVCALPGAEAGSLQKAIRDFEAVPSYHFTVSGPLGQVDGTFQKDQPIALKADQIEFYRKGDVLVYRQGEQWQRTRTGTVSDPLRILGASAKVKAVRVPHEELTVVSKAKIDWKKNDSIWTGQLDQSTAQSLAPIEDRDLARGGEIKIVVDANGKISSYETAIRIMGRRGNAEVDGTVTKKVALRDIGKAKIDVPAGAKNTLELPPKT